MYKQYSGALPARSSFFWPGLNGDTSVTLAQATLGWEWVCHADWSGTRITMLLQVPGEAGMWESPHFATGLLVPFHRLCRTLWLCPGARVARCSCMTMPSRGRAGFCDCCPTDCCPTDCSISICPFETKSF